MILCKVVDIFFFLLWGDFGDNWPCGLKDSQDAPIGEPTSLTDSSTDEGISMLFFTDEWILPIFWLLSELWWPYDTRVYICDPLKSSWILVNVWAVNGLPVSLYKCVAFGFPLIGKCMGFGDSSTGEGTSVILSLRTNSLVLCCGDSRWSFDRGVNVGDLWQVSWTLLTFWRVCGLTWSLFRWTFFSQQWGLRWFFVRSCEIFTGAWIHGSFERWVNSGCPLKSDKISHTISN